MDCGPCGWKQRGRRRGEPAVTIRDLGPSYGALHLQYVCAQHAQTIDSRVRLDRRMPDQETDGTS